ncbi:MAG: TonB family protein [Bacteroidota bacterium]
MKSVLTFVFCISFMLAASQQTNTYYDYRWKECEVANARFVSVVEAADSLWIRTDYYIREKKLQMKGYYKDKQCKIRHGYFTYYHSNGNIENKGQFVDNKKQGVWLRYHYDGIRHDSVNYVNDRKRGLKLAWFQNGVMSDSSTYDLEGKIDVTNWFDNGQLSSTGKVYHNKENGKWQYFHRNGRMSAEELYEVGKLISRVYYDEEGKVQSDTTNRDSKAECTKDWEHYLAGNLEFPPNAKFVNGDQAVVVVDFSVDEEGKVGEVTVYSSFHKLFDDLAVEVVKKSPLWKPAIDHNRRIKAYRRQPMTFIQDE